MPISIVSVKPPSIVEIGVFIDFRDPVNVRLLVSMFEMTTRPRAILCLASNIQL